MQTHLSLLLSVFTIGFIFCSVVFAQPSNDLKFDRLKYRYQINDIDGIGELIEPLWQQLIRGDAEFELAQQHLVATATTKFYVLTGEHHLAILPYLIGIQAQKRMEKESLEPLVEPLDASFGLQYLPPVFFSEKNQQQFQSQSDAAIDQGVMRESELVAKYRDVSPDRLDPIQTEMLAAISTAKANVTPSDRQVLRLIESFVTQQDKHSTLAHESLATAIEALQRLNRDDEAERLAAVFRTNFPDSQRLIRRRLLR